jgi:hypothetical protein
LKQPELLDKGVYITILHASLIPPHVGLIINGNYNSLTIKGRELNVSKEALLKTISQKKIETLFLKVVKHPVFSTDHQLLMFQEHLQQFKAVKQGEATCLSPVKLFFEEFYAIPNKEEQLLTDVLETLERNCFVEGALALHIKNPAKNNIFTFNSYTAQELQERIARERKLYYKD